MAQTTKLDPNVKVPAGKQTGIERIKSVELKKLEEVPANSPDKKSLSKPSVVSRQTKPVTPVAKEGLQPKPGARAKIPAASPGGAGPITSAPVKTDIKPVAIKPELNTQMVKERSVNLDPGKLRIDRSAFAKPDLGRAAVLKPDLVTGVEDRKGGGTGIPGRDSKELGSTRIGSSRSLVGNRLSGGVRDSVLGRGGRIMDGSPTLTEYLDDNRISQQGYQVIVTGAAGNNFEGRSYHVAVFTKTEAEEGGFADDGGDFIGGGDSYFGWVIVDDNATEKEKQKEAQNAALAAEEQADEFEEADDDSDDENLPPLEPLVTDDSNSDDDTDDDEAASRDPLSDPGDGVNPADVPPGFFGKFITESVASGGNGDNNTIRLAEGSETGTGGPLARELTQPGGGSIDHDPNREQFDPENLDPDAVDRAIFENTDGGAIDFGEDRDPESEGVAPANDNPVQPGGPGVVTREAGVQEKNLKGAVLQNRTLNLDNVEDATEAVDRN